MISPKEYTIKRFEARYPHIVKLIDIWTEHSIKQDWDCICVALNEYTVSDCPPDEYCNELKANRRYVFLTNLSERVGDYFLAQGYKMVSKSMGSTQIKTPEGKTMTAHVVRAYTKIIKG